MLSNEPKERMCVLAASASLWGALVFKNLASAISTHARLHRYNIYIYMYNCNNDAIGTQYTHILNDSCTTRVLFFNYNNSNNNNNVICFSRRSNSFGMYYRIEPVGLPARVLFRPCGSDDKNEQKIVLKTETDIILMHTRTHDTMR